MIKIILLWFLASSVSAAPISFRDTPLKEVADTVSQITGKPILIPSNIKQNISLFAPDGLSTKEVLNLFYSSLSMAGYGYEIKGRVIHVKPSSNQKANQSLYKVFTLDYSLPSDALAFLPEGTKVMDLGDKTLVSTSPDYLSLLNQMGRSERIKDSKQVSKVIRLHSVKPSKFLVFKSDDLDLVAFDDIDRLSVVGSQTDVNKLLTTIRKLDASLGMYQIDLVIVSASQLFSKSYDLNLSFAQDVFSMDLVNGLSASISSPFAHANNYSSLLMWIKTNSDLSIVQKPNVLVLDGQNAQLLVGQEVPFKTAKYDPTKSTGEIETVERRNVGLEVNMGVRSLNNGKIRINLTQELSSISPVQLEKSTDIITDKQRISTVLDVSPSRFYLIGGLSYRDKSLTTSSLPIFDEIPVLDNLFTDEKLNTSYRDLLIFIQVHDVDNPQVADAF
ncbi:MAG: general secretion pathway protein D [Thiomicrorhabdus sp.]|nr:MAG: general secretion pathway protein D [Thiomicrorhabdus sp.]